MMVTKTGGCFSKDDVERANKSVLETTFDGENVPLTQHHIVDVGFVAFHVAPLGGDKVFFHSSGTNEVLIVFNDDVDFFPIIS